jgi:hypothetical protein
VVDGIKGVEMRIIQAIATLAAVGPWLLHAGIVDAQTALAVKLQSKRVELYDLIAQVEAATHKLQVD